MALALATHCILTKFSENKLELTLAAKHAALLNNKLHERMAAALSRYCNTTITLQIKTATDELNTPAQQQQQEQAVRHADATEAIKNNSHVNTIIDLFNATLDVNSIKAI
jgi:hypothetical protein